MAAVTHWLQGIPAVPLGDRAAAVVKLAYRARRPLLLEGTTGVGKSELVRGVADELGIDCIVLDLSLLEPPDLVGLPVVLDGRTTFAAPRILPADGEGILLLEELNRTEKHMQATAYQLLTTRRLHEYELPPGWAVFAAVNPEDGEYEVMPMDPALRARFLNLKVKPDLACWRAWATRAGVHPAVLALAHTHLKMLDEVPPRSWKYASDVLHALTPPERADRGLLADALGGYLPGPWVEVLITEVQRAGAASAGEYDPANLLTRYHADAELRKKVRALRAAGRTDVLDQIVCRLLAAMGGPGFPDALTGRGFVLGAFEELLRDLPGDWRERLQQALEAHPRAALLLPVGPADVLAAGYASGPAHAAVAGWAADPAQAHRFALLAGAVAAVVQSPAEFGTRLALSGAAAGLAAFRRQVPPRCQVALDTALRKAGVTLPAA